LGEVIRKRMQNIPDNLLPGKDRKEWKAMIYNEYMKKRKLYSTGG
jgi:hypothetical protein